MKKDSVTEMFMDTPKKVTVRQLPTQELSISL